MGASDSRGERGHTEAIKKGIRNHAKQELKVLVICSR